MLTTGTDSKNPIYLVTPSGALVTDASGAPILFAGTVNTTHPSGYATDASGNFLMRADRTYIPCAEAAQAGLGGTVSAGTVSAGSASADDLATQPLRLDRPGSGEGVAARRPRRAPAVSEDELATQPLSISDSRTMAAPSASAAPRRRSAMRRAEANPEAKEASGPATSALPPLASSGAANARAAVQEAPVHGRAAQPSHDRPQARPSSYRAASAPTPAQPESPSPAGVDIATILPARRIESAELALRKTEAMDETSDSPGQLILKWSSFVLAGVAVVGLGMGGAWAFDHLRSGGEDAAQPAQSAAPEDASSGQDSQAQEDAPREVIQVPSEAYPGAGEDKLPEGAWQTGDASGSFDWMAPSGNIRCKADGARDELRCQIASWQTDKPAGIVPGTDKVADTVVLGTDGRPSLTATGGAIGKVDATLLYNTTIYDAKKNWACGAKENGITCWSLKSGHGFVIRRAGMLEF